MSPLFTFSLAPSFSLLYSTFLIFTQCDAFCRLPTLCMCWAPCLELPSYHRTLHFTNSRSSFSFGHHSLLDAFPHCIKSPTISFLDTTHLSLKTPDKNVRAVLGSPHWSLPLPKGTRRVGTPFGFIPSLYPQSLVHSLAHGRGQMEKRCKLKVISDALSLQGKKIRKPMFAFPLSPCHLSQLPVDDPQVSSQPLWEYLHPKTSLLHLEKPQVLP